MCRIPTSSYCSPANWWLEKGFFAKILHLIILKFDLAYHSSTDYEPKIYRGKVSDNPLAPYIVQSDSQDLDINSFMKSLHSEITYDHINVGCQFLKIWY